MKKTFDSLTLNSNLSTGYLRRYSHIKICENVGYLLAPKSVDELADIYRLAVALKQPIIPVGGASNILFGNCKKHVLVMEHLLPRKVEQRNFSFTVSANMNINTFIWEAAKRGFGGLEFLAGIPAHLSGLIKMNAGAFGQEISTFINRIKVVTAEGNITWLHKDEIIWNYRTSSIHDFILEAELLLQPEAKSTLLSAIRKNISQRRKSQPLTTANLGCFFKNPPGLSAGKLLDDCGMKGYQVNDAQISETHANFFVNKGNAAFSDMCELINIAKNRVKNMFGIDLQLEIEVIHS